METFIFNLMPAIREIKKFRWLAPMLIIMVSVFAAGCSDDETIPLSGGGEEQADSSVISLTYHNFTAEDDVIILDADTTQISVSKSLADKLGIDHFNGRPMAVWQKVNCLPYIRRATSEKLQNGRYILTVDKSASLADVLPEDTEYNFDTQIHVNHQSTKAWTRAGGSNLVEDISSRYMDGDTIHPAVILYTDPGSLGEDVEVIDGNGVQNSKIMTRATESDGYDYVTADQLDSSDVDWSIINKDVTLNANLKVDSKADVNIGLKVPVKAKINAKIQIKTGFSFRRGVTLKKFDTGVYGGLGFKPKLNLNVGKSFSLPKDKFTKRLISFPGYTTVFMVGIVPVSVTFNPGVTFKMDGTVTGKISTGLSYRFENEFKAGVLYEKSWKPYGEYKQKENKFSMDVIKGNVNVKTGIGFFVSCDALIYGFAGPELAVGPRLGLNADAAITVPAKGDPSFSFNANLKCGVQSLIGAKLKVWKWTVADWNTTFAISPEWTIWQYSTTS